MFEWLRSWGRKAQGQLSLVSPWLRSVVWTISRSFLALAKEGYANNSIVYACLRLLSQSVPEAPLLAYQMGAGEVKDPLPFAHPLAALIRAPNPLMTEYEMIELITLHLGIVGRSHWWKQRDAAGRVAALWPLRPDRVGPRYGGGVEDAAIARDARLSVLGGWTYIPPGAGEAQFIPLDDMLSFNFPDPAGETGGIVEGLGWVQVLAREIETDNEATTFVGALLKNNAMPGAVLQTKQPNLSKDAADRIKRIFGGQFGGVQRGMTAVLDAETTYTAAGFNLQQLEFPDLRNIAESRIAAAAGVPAVLVGLKVGIDAGIKATITEQRQYFSETTLANYWRRLADQFTNDLAAEFGDGIVCRFDTTKVKALAEHSKQQLQPIHDGFVAGGVLVDEYRMLYLNLPPLPNGAGQVVMVPNTSTPTVPATLLEPPPPPVVAPPAVADENPVPIGDAAKVRRAA
jgi:HK97 family phage portal protein